MKAFLVRFVIQDGENEYYDHYLLYAPDNSQPREIAWKWLKEGGYHDASNPEDWPHVEDEKHNVVEEPYGYRMISLDAIRELSLAEAEVLKKHYDLVGIIEPVKVSLTPLIPVDGHGKLIWGVPPK